MDTTFMNPINSKTSNPRRLLLNLTDKVNLKRSDYVGLSNLSIYYTWENIAKINLKYQLQHGMMNLNYLMDDVLYVL